jgi:hypothetical protein
VPRPESSAIAQFCATLQAIPMRAIPRVSHLFSDKQIFSLKDQKIDNISLISQKNKLSENFYLVIKTAISKFI